MGPRPDTFGGGRRLIGHMNEALLFEAELVRVVPPPQESPAAAAAAKVGRGGVGWRMQWMGVCLGRPLHCVGTWRRICACPGPRRTRLARVPQAFADTEARVTAFMGGKPYSQPAPPTMRAVGPGEK